MTRAKLSVAILACNEAANLRRTLESVAWADELVARFKKLIPKKVR